MEEHKVNYFQGLVQTGKAQGFKTCAGKTCIGLMVRMSILDTKGRRFEPQHQYVFSLSKRLYLHCIAVNSAVK